MSLILIDEVVHVEKLLRKIGNFISYCSIKNTKGIHISGKETPIGVNVNYLAVCIIQNVMETFHVPNKKG